MFRFAFHRILGLLVLAGLCVALTPQTSQASETQRDSLQTTCPSVYFMDVSTSAGAGPGYPQPTLSVSCSGSYFTAVSNSIPHYTYVSMTPNPLTARTQTYQITTNPRYQATTTSIPLLNEIGIAINGLPIFGPNEAGQPANQAYGDPVYNGIMDYCMGHTSQTLYHYHAMYQTCFYPTSIEGRPSPIIGYAFDGYPIYGPYGCVDAACTQVVKMVSSYDRIGNPTTYAWNAYQYNAKTGVQYLDRCNGRTLPDGSYGYYVTDTFPYILGCYHGVVDAYVNGVRK
jgi:hypothetical protein